MPTDDPFQTMQAGDFDRITLDQLRAGGGIKWTAWPDCIGAFIAEMDFGTAPAITGALEQVVAMARHGYVPNDLLRELSVACAGWQQRHYGWDVDPACVRAVPDVLYAFELALRHFLPAGAPVVLPSPHYMPFAPLLRLTGNPAVVLPMRPDGGRWPFDPDALERAFATGARLLLLCNPHNPTGHVYTPEELRQLSDIVDRHGARVFADEVHGPIVYDGRRHTPYASISAMAASHTITATSASKAWNLPGLKCAQMIFTNPRDLRYWRGIEKIAGHGTGTAGVIANTVAWREGGAWFGQVRLYLQNNRDLLAALLAEHLPEVRFIRPEATFLAWLDCSDLQLPEDPQAFFHRHARVVLTDGPACGQGGAGHVRLTFATPRPLLQAMVLEMARAVRQSGAS